MSFAAEVALQAYVMAGWGVLATTTPVLWTRFRNRGRILVGFVFVSFLVATAIGVTAARRLLLPCPSADPEGGPEGVGAAGTKTGAAGTKTGAGGPTSSSRWNINEVLEEARRQGGSDCSKFQKNKDGDDTLPFAAKLCEAVAADGGCPEYDKAMQRFFNIARGGHLPSSRAGTMDREAEMFMYTNQTMSRYSKAMSAFKGSCPLTTTWLSAPTHGLETPEGAARA